MAEYWLTIPDNGLSTDGTNAKYLLICQIKHLKQSYSINLKKKTKRDNKNKKTHYLFEYNFKNPINPECIVISTLFDMQLSRFVTKKAP